MVTRRVLIAGGAVAALGAVGAAAVLRRGGEPISNRTYDWPASTLKTGGTAGLPVEAPAATFSTQPQCVLIPDKTLGPCHTNDVPVRQEITEGVAGLPVWVQLRIVEAQTCAPVRDADVEIWHCNAMGVYSGRAADMCNPGDEEARAVAFLRGRQITDADGVASFLTVYPGWYSGRTPHIHMRILLDGSELKISQLLFDDSLNDLVYQGHPDYAGRPTRDTLNGGDGIFSASDAARFIFDVERLDDGALQASYTIGVARA